MTDPPRFPRLEPRHSARRRRSVNHRVGQRIGPGVNRTSTQAARVRDPEADFSHRFRRSNAATSRQRLPQNWPANVSARLWAARSIIEAEGIPLAYVPRADVVGLVFEAASRNDRVKVLLAHQNEILDDCDQALAVDLHSHVKGQVPLIRQAFASYRSGHVAASQALSVVVCDTLIRANAASKHTTAKTTAAGADLKLAIMAGILRMELALAPVSSFSPSGARRAGSLSRKSCRATSPFTTPPTPISERTSPSSRSCSRPASSEG